MGIGSLTPAAKLDVGGTTSTIANVSGNLSIIPASNLVVTQGNVGIGSATPGFKLDVNGIVNATALYVGGSPYIGSQWTTSASNIYFNTGNVGIGSTTPGAKLDITGGANISGNVGIGTTAPVTKLHVKDPNGAIASNGEISTVKVGAVTYKVHKYTYGTSTFTVPSSGVTSLQVLVVAGGGGAGMDMGGGGGGGGVISNPSYAVTPGQQITVTVGNGGAGAPAGGLHGQPGGHQFTIPAVNGENSVFGTLTAIGGGRGGSSYVGYSPGPYGAVGGSGGGSSGYCTSGGGGGATAGQGNVGGGGGGCYYSGGGGGAGSAGISGSAQPNGGNGITNAILGP